MCVLGISAHAEASFLDFFKSSEEAAPLVQLEEADAATATCNGSEVEKSSVVPEGEVHFGNGFIRGSKYIKYDPKKYESKVGSKPGVVIVQDRSTGGRTGYTCRGSCSSGNTCPAPVSRENSIGSISITCPDGCDGCKMTKVEILE